MKPRRIHQTLFLLLILCVYFSKCADCYNDCYLLVGSSCTGITACSNCKPRYNYNYNCYDCSSFPDYYSIVGGACAACTGDKIIDATKECTSANLPATFYQLGDVYYSYDPSSTDPEIQCSNKICSCKNYYYTEKIGSMTKYTCFSSINAYSSLGYKYYIYNQRELFKACPIGFNKQNVIIAIMIVRVQLDYLVIV